MPVWEFIEFSDPAVGENDPFTLFAHIENMY